jgi:endo-1,4-beta-xylanase
VAALAALLALGACTGPAKPGPTGGTFPGPDGAPSTPSVVTLRGVAPKGLLVGSSVVGGGHLAGTVDTQPLQTDAAYRELLGTQFSSLTPENALKWDNVEPVRDQYDFAAGDAIVAFAQQHGEQVRGHNLMWYRSNPAWLTKGSFSADELRQILHDHISAVVGRYKGKIAAWDVVNELFDQNGRLQPGNPFTDQLGVGIVADAFRWAHEADPAAVLYINDFNVETSATKRAAYLDLVRQLKGQGVPIGGMGIQSHLSLQTTTFPKDYGKTLKAFGELGVDVAVTELDVRMPLHGGQATADQLATQATWYKQAVQACLAVPRCVSITMWGVPDTYSWVPKTYPDQGAATVFADDVTPKPAFAAMVTALQAGRH